MIDVLQRRPIHATVLIFYTKTPYPCNCTNLLVAELIAVRNFRVTKITRYKRSCYFDICIIMQKIIMAIVYYKHMYLLKLHTSFGRVNFKFCDGKTQAGQTLIGSTTHK